MSKDYSTIVSEIEAFATNHTRARTAAEVRTLCQDILDYAKDAAPAAHTHTKSQISDWTHTHTKSEISDWSHLHDIDEINLLSLALRNVGWRNIPEGDITVQSTTEFDIAHSGDYDPYINVNTPFRFIYSAVTYYAVVTKIVDMGTANRYTISAALLDPLGVISDVYIGDKAKLGVQKFTAQQGAFLTTDDAAIYNKMRELFTWQHPESYPVILTAFCKRNDGSGNNPMVNFKRIRMSDVEFTGIGVNDMLVKGVFTGTFGVSSVYFEIELTSPTAFKWRHETGGAWSDPVSITDNVWYPLEDGIAVGFTGGVRNTGDTYSFVPQQQLIFADNSEAGIEVSEVLNTNDPDEFVANYSLEPNDRLEIVVDQNSGDGDAEDVTIQLIYIIP